MKTKTLTAHMGRGVQKALIMWCLCTFAFVYMAHCANTQITTGDADAQKPLAVGSPAELASRMGECWDTGNHGMPTHVIYRTLKGGEWKIGGSEKVGIAFDQLFGNGPKRVVVFKFCR